MTRLYLLEPAHATGLWTPFAGVRPVAELRAGAFRIRERWERALGLATEAILDDLTAGFADVDAPPVVPGGAVTGPAILAASDFAPTLARIAIPSSVARLTSSGRTVARILRDGESAGDLGTGGPSLDVTGMWLGGAHHLLDAAEQLLAPDAASLDVAASLPAGSIILGDATLIRGDLAGVEPGVVFDLRHGPVAIAPGAEVRNGGRLEGPCWIGPGARIVGGFVRASVIGPMCVVHGEVSSSVFLGYANKAHDGFVGHSVIGHWVNLGALTTTSNLKNTYGPVRLVTPTGSLDTGRQFLGSLIADHAKTAIGTMLGTGTEIGTGASVFGASQPPRWVPPFAWGGSSGERMNLDGFLAIAGRVLPRRGVTVTPAHTAWLTALYRRLS